MKEKEQKMADSSIDLDNLVVPFGKARSKVWDYFGFRRVRAGPAIKENLDMEYVYCKQCGKRYAYKGNVIHL